MLHAISSIFHASRETDKSTMTMRKVMSSRWKIGLWIVGGTMLAIVAALIVVSVVISRRARVWAEDWMTHEYNGNVELSAFRVAIPFPLVQCEGENLVLHFLGRKDLPPLIAVRRFTMRTSLWGLLRSSRRIQYLKLEGLQINVPPREEQNSDGTGNNFSKKFRKVRFDEIISENAILKILAEKPGKNPLEFDVQHLRLNSSGADDALKFHATLSNPRPPGEIVSTGLFGPWNPETPSLTPVSGNYDFEKADLSVFPGIAGILSSKGSYQGVLEKIRVDGTTDTPDFRVTRAGHSVDLSTTFHATVDGTDGDTYLQPVEAHFGQTDLLAQGSVEGTKGLKGKIITLDVSAGRARIEDLLLLAMRESPSMTGPIHFKTKFTLAPGHQEIPDRLNLNGTFDLDSVHFSSSTVQQKVDNMSKRSEGKPKEVVNPADAISTDDVASVLKGNFRLANGILSLAGLNFAIPGTEVQLAGTYALDPETLDLHGNLKMQAKLSQTTTGVKSFLLKFADPLFSKGGNGAVVPIKITGPVQHPHYGLELGRKSEASAENR
jgi:hypothetical protein